MPRKPLSPRLKSIPTSSDRPPTWWTIYKLAAKQTWLGVVEAIDEREAVEKAAVEFKQRRKPLPESPRDSGTAFGHAPKLMAVPRSTARSS